MMAEVRKLPEADEILELPISYDKRGLSGKKGDWKAKEKWRCKY